VDWVANGSFPLLNAFYNLLDKQLQEQLLPIAHFFLMSAHPRASGIERFTAHLAIATVIQSTLEMPQYSASDEQQDHASTTKPVILKRLRLVPLDSITSMIGQLVADLGLGQRVVDISWSLIGHLPARHIYVQVGEKTDPNNWSPPPLQRAHPKNIRCTEDCCAVIVVACKMCSGWESWQCLQPPFQHRKEPLPVAAAWNNGEDKEAPKAVQRLIPWNGAQFCLVKNEHISDYLDLFEENIKDQRDQANAFPEFTALLDEAITEKP
jgi:hypothetical protein